MPLESQRAFWFHVVTNTCLEGDAADLPKARRGHSKESRAVWPKPLQGAGYRPVGRFRTLRLTHREGNSGECLRYGREAV